MKDPVFLTLEQVEILHWLGLQQHGGQDGLRDRAAFESATMHPQNAWFYGGGDLFDVAAAYTFHLAESQAFIDGNKRVGMAAAITFPASRSYCDKPHRGASRRHDRARRAAHRQT